MFINDFQHVELSVRLLTYDSNNSRDEIKCLFPTVVVIFVLIQFFRYENCMYCFTKCLAEGLVIASCVLR